MGRKNPSLLIPERLDIQTSIVKSGLSDVWSACFSKFTPTANPQRRRL